ncbi:MAG TPA: molybdate ABC transporter substrate-binding protein [Casimicrobiaceae bacterium]|nr:molybdate ABC transporter substrate-binding protein [Casimicrobiaceae bacterium]
MLTGRFIAAALAVLCAVVGTPRAVAADVVVFAAASLKEALDDQAKQFEAASGSKVVISYGGSNALAKQIESGAPADVLISADLDWMDYVDRKGLVVTGTRVNLLRNTLVLIAPAASKSALRIGPNFGLAAALGSDKLAMANPDSVPAGKYGKAALEHLGVWASVEKQVARAENVRAALALVSRGETPYGIVYATDALSDKGVRVVDTFPAESYPPIVYPAALMTAGKSPAAKPLLEFLRSVPARATWERYGFALAQ